jgi:hypothetical protein
MHRLVIPLIIAVCHSRSPARMRASTARLFTCPARIPSSALIPSDLYCTVPYRICFILHLSRRRRSAPPSVSTCPGPGRGPDRLPQPAPGVSRAHTPRAHPTITNTPRGARAHTHTHTLAGGFELVQLQPQFPRVLHPARYAPQHVRDNFE